MTSLNGRIGEECGYEACISLLHAFWARVREDMRTGHHATSRWLEGPAFERWVEVSFGTRDPDHIRGELRRQWNADYLEARG